jgi:membrane associated rhomboid family serine protease
MQRLLAALPSLIIFSALLCLFGIATIAGIRQRRRDRRRILAEGVSAEAVIAAVITNERSDGCRVRFRFQPDIAGPQLEAAQKSTVRALKSLGLGEGSSVRVYYLPKWPRYAFIKALAVAERVEATKLPAGASASESLLPSVYFISYVAPGATKTTNAFRWTGDGDITIGATVIRFAARRARPFWFPKVIEQDFPRDTVTNVEVFANAVRCEISEPYKKPRALQFWAVNAEEAKAIGAQLPDSKTATFVPQLAERAAFNTRLLEVNPRAPVTPVIIGINVVLFVIAAALGGGILVPNAEVLIRLGSDYTPLTAAGEWWRLLASTFLHFGILHLAFNMWALWVNGILAERLYGSTRYLTLYLVAGVAGSVTSFLWHPFVNGAGASGAIFGVLGALFAYFLRTDSGVPKSVIKAQRNTAGIFIVISLLNAARVRGIDNAAHLGGVAAGFVMGWLLCRPLDVKRDEQDWTAQWARVVIVVVASVLFVGYSLSSGQWHPRVVHDASGRPVLLAELVPPPQSFGGVTLGMTSEELLRVKGKPIQEELNDWIYNSIDSAHDGVLDVYLTEGANGHSPIVWAILFWGKREAEPPGIANLLAFTRQDLLMRYGTPRSESDRGRDAKYLYFRNGIIVWLDADKVRAYGVYAPQQ